MAENLPLDPAHLPTHIGIIMDGNGRWARNRNKPRTEGHREGLNAAKATVKASADLGLRYLTLYTFSTENWKRAEDETSFLMQLIKIHLKKEYDFYREHRIRVIHSGDINKLPKDVQEEIVSVMRDTSEFTGLTLNLAINYGGRNEIVRAINRWFGKITVTDKGKIPAITENDIKENLDCPELPDADLIIRTGGEQRLSNFLLWRSAYAEYYFSEKLWPDWQPSDLYKAIYTYQQRERRFGAAK
ncbi:MAG: di-trans,poly-cis-decaprenylcistransferase [Spirochaetes bacterium]|nr:MAG: di-trans,poly-cis-decaprenylcistransferase [Spirochaetota bacterium]